MRQVGENSSLLENSRQGDGNGLARQINPDISHAANTTELLADGALMEEAKETGRLLNQFKEIRDLCNNNTKSDFKFFQEDETDLMNDTVDKGYGAIPIEVLKTLIGRLETAKTPINIIPVGEDRMGRKD